MLATALKGKRSMYIPETKTFRDTPVYDGHKMHFGNRITGPAMIEQVTTAIFVSDSYDCAVDALGSFVIWQKGREDLAAACFEDNEEVTA
jgi:N-methylhydantoinase A